MPEFTRWKAKRVTGMSRRWDGKDIHRREDLQRARICSDRRRKEHIFLGIIVVPLCLIFFTMTMTACNQNVSQSNMSNVEVQTVDVVNRDVKSDGEITEETVSLSEVVEDVFPDSFRLQEYEWLNQYPELPTGCEITSLTSVLNYYGCDVDKTTMADNYLKKGYGSFYEMFLGNPRESSSFGCMAQPIVDAANKYFNSNNILMRAENISGSDFDDILKKVSHGNPVVIWNTIGMKQAFESQTLLLDGEEYAWIAPEHCVVIIGYDLNKSIVYIMDPMIGNVTRDLETFEQRYESMHSQAMYIAE